MVALRDAVRLVRLADEDSAPLFFRSRSKAVRTKIATRSLLATLAVVLQPPKKEDRERQAPREETRLGVRNGLVELVDAGLSAPFPAKYEARANRHDRTSHPRLTLRRDTVRHHGINTYRRGLRARGLLHLRLV